MTRTDTAVVRGVISFTLLLLLGLPGWAFDHDAAAIQAGCGLCHTATPTAQPDGRLASDQRSLVPSAGDWCLGCHEAEARSCHPVGLSASTGAGLPLEGGDGLGCLTCHSPHRNATASDPWVADFLDRPGPAGRRTFLLVSPNPGGELCRKCHLDGDSQPTSISAHSARTFEARSFAGSKACAACHEKIFRAWLVTPHARMTRQLAEVEGVKGLTSADLEWPVEKVRFVLGTHFVHRFVAEATGTLLILPKIWDRQSRSWLATRDYGWTNRAWNKQCIGCHTTGYSPTNESFVEAGIGCEGCHGPALNHVRTGSPRFVSNPANFPPDRREMLCESCHTSGLDNTGQYHFPVGYRPGDDLGKFYSGLTPKPGQDDQTFVGDESPEDRHRQWEFMKGRLFLAKGLTCDYCQNFRNVKTASGTEFFTYDQYCLTCHDDRVQHPAESPGEGCTRCHPPMMTASGEYSIHDHKFRFP